jgi:hypothetical protein
MLDRHCKSENLNEKKNLFELYERQRRKKEKKKYQMVTHFQIRL